MSMFLFLTGCLINTRLYEERAAELADDDGDGWRPVDGDCDDDDSDRHPENPERCDGQDQDCDGEIDEGPPTDAPTWYPDLDGDGHGDPAGAVVACAAPAGFVERAGDCADDDATVNPEAEEACDGQDQDCDGEIDEGPPTDAPTWYPDLDGDGHGDSAGAVVACAAPAGFVERAGDCDDGAASVNPGATEVCGNGVDDNCNEDITECRWEGTSLADRHVARWEGEGYWTLPLLTDPLPGDPDGLLLRGFSSYTDTDGGFRTECTTLAYPANAEGEILEADALARLSIPDHSCGGLADLGDVDGDGYSDIALATGGSGYPVYRIDGPIRGGRELEEGDRMLVQSEDESLGHPLTMKASARLYLRSLALGYHASGEEQVRTFSFPSSDTKTTADYDARIRASTPGSSFGFALAWGDEDGDGVPDLMITSYLDPVRIATVHRGPLAGDFLDAEADRQLLRDSLDTYPGIVVEGGHDLDADGREDWLLADPLRTAGSAQAGTVYFWPGGDEDEQTSTELPRRLEGRNEEQFLGYGITVVDLDRDGVLDLALGSLGHGGSLAFQYGPTPTGVTTLEPARVGPSDLLALFVGFPISATLADRVVVGVDLRPITGNPYDLLLFHHLQP